MKKLLTITVLSLSLGLSSQSFADSNIYGRCIIRKENMQE